MATRKKRSSTPTPAQLAARARFAANARLQAAQRRGTVTRVAKSKDKHKGEGRDRDQRMQTAPSILIPRGMNKHLVLTTATATAAATSGTAGAAVSGDSLTTRNYGKEPMIRALWHTNQTAGFGQLSWPTAHDTTRGYRYGAPAAATELVLPRNAFLNVTPQEVISSLIAGTAVAGDVEQQSWLTEYDEDRGQHWLTEAEMWKRATKLTTVEASLTSAAGPNYSGTELITADSALLQANRDYAVLGFSSRTRVHLAGIVGPDTGNDRIACPCMLRPDVTARFFPDFLGMVPVINSGNAGSTNFFVHTDENAGTFVITCYLALLARRGQ